MVRNRTAEKKQLSIVFGGGDMSEHGIVGLVRGKIKKRMTAKTKGISWML